MLTLVPTGCYRTSQLLLNQLMINILLSLHTSEMLLTLCLQKLLFNLLPPYYLSIGLGPLEYYLMLNIALMDIFGCVNLLVLDTIFLYKLYYLLNDRRLSDVITISDIIITSNPFHLVFSNRYLGSCFT